MKLSDWLFRQRVTLDYTQSGVAHTVFCSRNTINRIENGGPVTVPRLTSLFDLYGIPPKYVLESPENESVRETMYLAVAALNRRSHG